MAVSSAKGDVSRDATAQVIEWFWRSSQFNLHLKSVACTVPVGVTKCFKRPKVIYKSAGITYFIDHSAYIIDKQLVQKVG